MPSTLIFTVNIHLHPSSPFLSVDPPPPTSSSSPRSEFQHSLAFFHFSYDSASANVVGIDRVCGLTRKHLWDNCFQKTRNLRMDMTGVSTFPSSFPDSNRQINISWQELRYLIPKVRVMDLLWFRKRTLLRQVHLRELVSWKISLPLVTGLWTRLARF